VRPDVYSKNFKIAQITNSSVQLQTALVIGADDKTWLSFSRERTRETSGTRIFPEFRNKGIQVGRLSFDQRFLLQGEV